MAGWRDRRILDLFGIEAPILLAPMAGPSTPELAIAVSEAGGLGALACAMLSVPQARDAVARIRARTARPFNLNFFCHVPPAADPARERAWQALLAPYRGELGLAAGAEAAPAATRAPFDEPFCALVEECRPSVVSFHFGLPEPALLERVRASGAKVIASATTVREAVWLEERGCDAVIAQGVEAGGHRGNFLDEDVTRQVGTLALVPQVADAVSVPVIAAGGIADGRGVAAALMLGAAAAQIGTAYLLTPEAATSPLHRRALAGATADGTALTNLFTGRPARGLVNRLMREQGPISDMAPPFPLAGNALAPLRAVAEAKGRDDFTPMWAGEAAPLARELPAGALTRRLAAEALALLEEP